VNRMSSLIEVIEEQAQIIQRQAESISRLSLLLQQYMEQEEIDRILQEEDT